MFPYVNPAVSSDIAQPAPETVLLLNRETGRYVRLGHKEFEWLTSFNGQIDTAEIPALLGKDQEFVDELLRRMADAQLVFFSSHLVQMKPQRADAPVYKQKIIEWTNFGQLRIHVARAQTLLAWTVRWNIAGNRILNLLGFALAAVGVVLGTRILQLAHIQLLAQTYRFHFWQIATFIGMIFLTTVFHELGHAVAAAHFGVRVRSLGMMLYYFQPAAYADITASWELSSPWQKAIIYGAGIYVQAILTGIASLLWLVAAIAGHSSLVLALFIASNLFVILFNLLPFIKVDGYWIASSLLGVPNLRDRALEWVFVWFRSVLLRRPISPGKLRFCASLEMPRMEQALLGCYGISCALFGLGMWLAGTGFLYSVAEYFKISETKSSLMICAYLLVTGGAYAAWKQRSRTAHSPFRTEPLTENGAPGNDLAKT
jgi:Zn-dependent protease